MAQYKILEESPNLKVKLEITLLPQEKAQLEEKASREVQKKVKIPGFRQGKAPLPLIKTQFASLFSKAYEKIFLNQLPSFCPQEILESIHVIESIQELPGGEILLTYERKPIVELYPIEKIPVYRYKYKIKSSILKEFLSTLQKSLRSLEESPETTYKKGDIGNFQIFFQKDGQTSQPLKIEKKDLESIFPPEIIEKYLHNKLSIENPQEFLWEEKNLRVKVELQKLFYSKELSPEELWKVLSNRKEEEKIQEETLYKEIEELLKRLIYIKELIDIWKNLLEEEKKSAKVKVGEIYEKEYKEKISLLLKKPLEEEKLQKSLKEALIEEELKKKIQSSISSLKEEEISKKVQEFISPLEMRAFLISHSTEELNRYLSHLLPIQVFREKENLKEKEKKLKLEKEVLEEISLLLFHGYPF